MEISKFKKLQEAEMKLLVGGNKAADTYNATIIKQGSNKVVLVDGCSDAS